MCGSLAELPDELVELNPNLFRKVVLHLVTVDERPTAMRTEVVDTGNPVDNSGAPRR